MGCPVLERSVGERSVHDRGLHIGNPAQAEAERFEDRRGFGPAIGNHRQQAGGMGGLFDDGDDALPCQAFQKDGAQVGAMTFENRAIPRGGPAAQPGFNGIEPGCDMADLRPPIAGPKVARF